MCTWVVEICLIVFCTTSLIGAAAHPRTAGTTDVLTDMWYNVWGSLDGKMALGRAHGAVVSWRGRLIIVGGCRDQACQQQLSVVDIVDPSGQIETRHLELPIQLGRGNDTSTKKTHTPMELAGPTSAVRVDHFNGKKSSSIFIVGACTYFYPNRERGAKFLLSRERLSGIWELSDGLTEVSSHYSIRTPMDAKEGYDDGNTTWDTLKLRSNATCVSREQLLFIVGGVDVNTGTAVSGVDVFDTVSRRYFSDVFNLTTALRNPLVVLDNTFMYVTAGDAQYTVRRMEALTPQFRECVRVEEWNNTENETDYIGTVRYWCPFMRVQIVRLGNRRLNELTSGGEDNEGFPLSVYFTGTLPNNTEFAFRSSTDRYLFVFNGKLCAIMNTTYANCLDVEEYFLRANRSDRGRLPAVGWMPLFYARSSSPPDASTFFASPIPTGMFGVALMFFNIGGFVNGSASTHLFYLTGDIFVPGVLNVSSVQKVNATLDFALHPPCSGVVRLSSNPICTDNVAGTRDVAVSERSGVGTRAVFHPVEEAANVYICFANTAVGLPCDTRHCHASKMDSFFYTPITISPFSIRREIRPPPSDEPDNFFYLLLILGCCTATVAAMMAVVFGTFRSSVESSPTPELMDFLLPKGELEKGDNCFMHYGQCEQEGHLAGIVKMRKRKNMVGVNEVAFPNVKHTVHRADCKTEMDMVVRNTTRDSRYEVVRRIGEGAFSSVYLVKKKHSRQYFALKYLICRDNKERLDALRECETIHSLQGHPNIIHIVEMFMNYEFDNGVAVHCTPTTPATPVAAVSGGLTLKRCMPVPNEREVKKTVITKPIAKVGGSCALIERGVTQQQRTIQVGEVGNVPISPRGALAAASPLAVAYRDGAGRTSSKAPRNAMETRAQGVGAEAVRRHQTQSEALIAKPAESEGSTLPPPNVHETSCPLEAVLFLSPSANAVEENEPEKAMGAAPVPLKLKTSSHLLTAHPVQEQQGVEVHYPNFPRPTEPLSSAASPCKLSTVFGCPLMENQVDALPLVKGKESLPTSGIRYNDFDIALATADDSSQRQLTPRPAPAAPNYVQLAERCMLYHNFVVGTLGSNVTNAPPATSGAKPRSVAEAVRTARLLNNSTSGGFHCLPDALPNVLAEEAADTSPTQNIPLGATCDSPSVMQEKANVRKNCSAFPATTRTPINGVRQEGDVLQLNPGKRHADKNDAAAQPKEEPAARHGAPPGELQVNNGVKAQVSPRPVSGGLVHSRYLGLVVEYHPLGDLCGYAIRHSAMHNSKLRLRLEEEKAHAVAALKENGGNSLNSSTVEVRLVSCNENGSPATEGNTGNVPSPTISDRAGERPQAEHITQQFSELSNEFHNPNPAIHSTVGGSLQASDACEQRVKCSDSESKLYRSIEDEFVMRENPFSEPQLLSIAYQLSSALHHLHSHCPPIVHRDLKPENILIRSETQGKHGCSVERRKSARNHDRCGEGHEDGVGRDETNPAVAVAIGNGELSGRTSPRIFKRSGCSSKLTQNVIPIVVTDFGLAFVLEGRGRTGRGGGTRPYIAPECWSGQTTTASDLWSLGCVLYALATARVTVHTVRIMYEEAEREGFAAMVLNDILARNYSLEFASFVLSLLVINPGRRLSAKMAMECFEVVRENGEDQLVRFDPRSHFFSDVQKL